MATFMVLQHVHLYLVSVLSSQHVGSDISESLHLAQPRASSMILAKTIFSFFVTFFEVFCLFTIEGFNGYSLMVSGNESVFLLN
jgi:hypothetical protein